MKSVDAWCKGWHVRDYTLISAHLLVIAFKVAVLLVVPKKKKPWPLAMSEQAALLMEGVWERRNPPPPEIVGLRAKHPMGMEICPGQGEG